VRALVIADVDGRLQLQLIAVVVVGASWALGKVVKWWRRPNRRARRMLAGFEAKSLAAVVEGEVALVRGVAHRAQALLDAPFSGRKCIGYRAVIEADEDLGWNEIYRFEECPPFLLSADGAEASVEGPFLVGLKLDLRIEGPPTDANKETLRKLGIGLVDRRGKRLSVRFFEGVLQEGESIWVRGRVRTTVDARGRSEELRGPPILRVFEGTKGQPVVLTDEENPGKIDAPSG
jgi:hypothetical protein